MDLRKEIHDYIQTHQDEILATWRDIVDIPSKVNQKEDLENCCNKLMTLFEGIGFKVEKHEVSETNGPLLFGTLGADRPGKPILFSGHYDTVPLPGDHPFRIDEQGHVRGLGCHDMKGGIAITYHICRMLNDLGWAERPVRIMFLGDEEKGHSGSRAGEIMAKLAPGALCDFNMESATLEPSITVGRRGDVMTKMTIHGVGAHSGSDFLRGRSAVSEAAHKIPLIEALTDIDKGTTVIVTKIEGGTMLNSVPPICTMMIDGRTTLMSERHRIMAAMEEIAASSFIDGCTAEVSFEEYMPPFEPNDDNRKLAAFVSDIAEELGFAAREAVRVGGGSDASHVAMAGVPAICSVGVRGQFNHTENEYALVDSLFEQTEVLANAVVRIDEFASGSDE